MKQEEIKALEKLTAAIMKIDDEDPGGAYLLDLVAKKDHIARNLQDDFPWESGIYVSQEEHDTVRKDLQEEIQVLKDKLQDAQSWDVRELRRREQEAKQGIQEATEEKRLQEDELKRVQERLQGV